MAAWSVEWVEERVKRGAPSEVLVWKGEGERGIGVHSQTVNEVYVELLAGNVC